MSGVSENPNGAQPASGASQNQSDLSSLLRDSAAKQEGAGSMVGDISSMLRGEDGGGPEQQMDLKGASTGGTGGWEQEQKKAGADSSSSIVGSLASSCCFIFLEATNGQLPFSVRSYRDTFAPELSAERSGYVNMSKWLVPAMKRSKVVKALVNFLMVGPLTAYARAYYKRFDFGWINYPIKSFWFFVWRMLA